MFTGRLKNKPWNLQFVQRTRSSRLLGGLDLGPQEAMSLLSVRLLSDSGQNTGPAGLCGWAEGGTGRVVRRVGGRRYAGRIRRWSFGWLQRKVRPLSLESGGAQL